jgi:hypothetical protein
VDKVKIPAVTASGIAFGVVAAPIARVVKMMVVRAGMI